MPPAFRFPIRDVKIESSSLKTTVKKPVFKDDYHNISQDEFSLNIENTAWFYASGGNYISIWPDPGADNASIELYLNGSVYGAIMHQRKIMPMHGSSFLFRGEGIMICGDAGAGKSSLTASFCINGAPFLTDDVTPLIFKEGRAFIYALSDRIKLWADTLKQLKQEEDGLPRIWPEAEKFYWPVESVAGDTFPLGRIFIIEIGEKDEIRFEQLTGPAKFTALRNGIYRYEYLQGMPDTEKEYVGQLLKVAEGVEVVRVVRPGGVGVRELYEEVERVLAESGERKA
jgi:hypothetical protein